MEWGSGCGGLPTAAGRGSCCSDWGQREDGSDLQQHRETESEGKGNTLAQTAGCEEVALERRPPSGQTGNCLQVYTCVYQGMGIAITLCIEN